MSEAAGRRILIGLAIFAMVWAVVRAHVQSITIDEAVTYINFVNPPDATFWTAHANNHVLNSILAKIFTKTFGTWNLTVRAGALIGAAVFILASYSLSVLIAESNLLRISLFACLVFNPLIFDFLVAARGYGLASGFLLSAICLVAYARRREDSDDARPLARACGWASLCIGLSFMSNFSFAFVDALTIALLYLWASEGTAFHTRARLAAVCFLPCLLIVGAFTPVLLEWNRSELNYGAAHLSETFQSLYEASFYELRPFVRDLVFIDVPGVILPIFGIFAAWRIALIWINRRSMRDAGSRWFLTLVIVPIVAVVASVFVHWVVFRITGTPLPMDRTGIYIVVLMTLFLGGMAAIPIPTRAGELTGRGLTILMVVLASYFLLCLRVSYFKEWKWNSDVDKIYSVLARYNHACGLKQIAANWRYDGTLNYYLAISGRETIPPLSHYSEYPEGHRAYVVFQPEDRDFLAKNALTLVYQTRSGAAIALDSAMEPPPGESTCPLTLPAQSK